MFKIYATCKSQDNLELTTQKFIDKSYKRIFLTLTPQSITDVFQKTGVDRQMRNGRLSITVYGKKNISDWLDVEREYTIVPRFWKSADKSGIKFVLKL